ncbi:hypothetical protein SNE32_18060, partial [Lysobacter sp. D1-1-M9]|uniref:hypothetical protein n=1 Tax=Novilysobacter longmucuonensis TaxID=3098603 RepID=UPI002FCC366D
WCVYFFAAILSFVYGSFMLFFEDAGDMLEDSSWYGLLIGVWVLAFAVSLPLFIALWRYAFRSPDIWRDSTGAV